MTSHHAIVGSHCFSTIVVQGQVPGLPKELAKVASVLPKCEKPAFKNRAACFPGDVLQPLSSASCESAHRCHVFGGQFGDHIRIYNAHTFQPIHAIARDLPPRLILEFVFKTHARMHRNIYAALFVIAKEQKQPEHHRSRELVSKA